MQSKSPTNWRPPNCWQVNYWCFGRRAVPGILLLHINELLKFEKFWVFGHEKLNLSLHHFSISYKSAKWLITKSTMWRPKSWKCTSFPNPTVFSALQNSQTRITTLLCLGGNTSGMVYKPFVISASLFQLQLWAQYKFIFFVIMLTWMNTPSYILIK